MTITKQRELLAKELCGKEPSVMDVFVLIQDEDQARDDADSVLEPLVLGAFFYEHSLAE